MSILLHRLIDILLVFNRTASKVEIGPLYFLDWLILFIAFIYPLRLLKALFYLWPVLLFLFFSIAWLIVDCSTSCVADTLRRFALGFYIIIPAALITVRYSFDFSSKLFYYYLLLVMVLLIFYDSIDYIRISLLAEFAGILLLFVLFTDVCKKRVALKIIVALLFFVSVMHPSLTGTGGIYKTPLAAFVLSVTVIFSGRFLIPLIKNKLISIKQILFVTVGAIVISVLLVSTSPGRLFLGEMIQGVGGIFGAESISENVENWVGERERASSYGTAASRVYFWKEIFKYSSNDAVKLLIGNGYEYGFMEVTEVGCIFPDCEHIEPHNSIVGIFFRFGVIGVILFILTVFYVHRLMHKNVDKRLFDRTFIWATSIYGIVFINFEVALESPHGALLFWVIVMSPLLFKGRSSA